jgi:hypothetical protein
MLRLINEREGNKNFTFEGVMHWLFLPSPRFDSEAYSVVSAEEKKVSI